MRDSVLLSFIALFLQLRFIFCRILHHSERKIFTFPDIALKRVFEGRCCIISPGFMARLSRICLRTPPRRVALQRRRLKTIFHTLFTESAIQNRYNYKFFDNIRISMVNED